VVNETIPALVDVVKAGKARFIGVTGYPISVLKEAVERSSFKVDCVLCYARSTLHDNTLLEYLPFFQVNILHYQQNLKQTM
jgi:L-galactose dehydrogenase